jgi:hypothetical protein
MLFSNFMSSLAQVKAPVCRVDLRTRAISISSLLIFRSASRIDKRYCLKLKSVGGAHLSNLTKEYGLSNEV